MRFSEEELIELAKLPPDVDGVLQFKTQASRIRDQIQGYKSRWFKLKGNFLFYYRINDEGKVRELLGAFLMERFRILMEMKPNAYAFSIAFQNDRERKYIFLTSSNTECQRWVSALKNASYEKLQTQFFLLQQRLVRITGKKPVQRHGLQRYYVDFLSEDGIELNDDEEETKNTKEMTSNPKHPLAVIQEQRFCHKQSGDLQENNHIETCALDLQNKLDIKNDETNSSLCGDEKELDVEDVGKKIDEEDETVTLSKKCNGINDNKQNLDQRTKNTTKEMISNRRHPLALIEEQQICHKQCDESQKKHHVETCASNLQKEKDVRNGETNSSLRGDMKELDVDGNGVEDVAVNNIGGVKINKDKTLLSSKSSEGINTYQ